VASVISVILARSGFGASTWLGLPAVLFASLGAVFAATGSIKLLRSFRAYGAEASTLAQLDRCVEAESVTRFAGLQILAVGLLLAAATVVAFLLPGMAAQAAFVAVFLTAAIWAAESLPKARQIVGGAVERLVDGALQTDVARLLAFWRRPYAGWRLVDRVALARKAGVADPLAAAYLNALDSHGVVRPNVAQCGPSVAADARWRFSSLVPVFVISLPFAVIAWAAAAWLPDNWVPRLPSPAALFGLESPPAPKDDAAPSNPDQTDPAEGEQAGDGSEGGGNSGEGNEGQAGARGPDSGNEGGAGPQGPEGEQAGQQGAADGDQSGASAEGSSEPEGGDGAPEGDGSEPGSDPDTGSGTGGTSLDEEAPSEDSGQANSGPEGQAPEGNGSPDTGAGQGGDAEDPSSPPTQEHSPSGAGESGTGGDDESPAEAPGAQQPDPAAQTDGTAETPAEAGTAPTKGLPQATEPADGAPQATEPADDPESTSDPGDLAEAPTPSAEGTGETPPTTTGDASAQSGSDLAPPQDIEILDGPAPPDAQPIGLEATDAPPPLDAEQVELSATGSATPIPDQGELLDIGTPQALFAEPGQAPDTVETRLDADAVLPPDLPAGPTARQKVPAWISDLMND